MKERKTMRQVLLGWGYILRGVCTKELKWVMSKSDRIENNRTENQPVKWNDVLEAFMGYENNWHFSSWPSYRVWASLQELRGMLHYLENPVCSSCEQVKEWGRE